MNIIITQYNPDRTGASKMCYYIAEKLRRKNHNVILLHGKITDKKDTYINELEGLGCKAYFVRGLGNPFYLVGILKTMYYIGKYKADMVLSMNLRDRVIGVISAELMNIKSMVHCGNKHSYHGNPLSIFIKYIIYKNTVVKYADKIICTSAIVQDELLNIYHISPEKLSLVFNGINIKTDSELLPKTSNIGPLRISFVGRIDHQKGLHILLESLKMIIENKMTQVPFTVNLVGDVSVSANQAASIAYRSSLEAFVAENSLQAIVKFIPFQKSIDPILADTDIYVQPSLFEGLPLSVLEAMNYKLPLVITDECGFPSSFKNGYHALIVANNNAKLLAEGLAKMINSTPEERSVFSTNAYNYLLSNFDIEMTTDKIINSFPS